VTQERFDGGRRRCAFCDSDEKLTREHVIPQWLAEALHEMEPGDPDPEWRADYWAGGMVERDRNHPMPRPTVVVRHVCEACNTGWMADLEGRAKPLIEPMVRGQRTTLDLAQQVEVATWASKTVLALEYHEPDTVVARPQDRRIVMEQLRPPSHHRVRLAHRDAVGESLVAKMLVARTEDAENERPDAFAVLFGIGYLLLQVWGGHGADTGPGLAATGTKIDRAVMIWPPVPTAVEWPSNVPIADEEFDEVAREVIPWADDSPDMAEWRRRRAEE
jgi:hypothetical protein